MERGEERTSWNEIELIFRRGQAPQDTLRRKYCNIGCNEVENSRNESLKPNGSQLQAPEECEVRTLWRT